MGKDKPNEKIVEDKERMEVDGREDEGEVYRTGTVLWPDQSRDALTR